MAMLSRNAMDRIFAQLKSKSEDKRYAAQGELHDLVISAARELPSDGFQELMNTINNRISALVINSVDASDKIGGILAIEQLIALDIGDAAQATTRYSNCLRQALQSNDNKVLVFAARALGHLATPGGAFTAELVEAEVSRALEWLSTERQEVRRFAAVLVIRELARNSPTLIYAFRTQIFDCIWVALRDDKVLIRETASEAAGACFEIITARDSQVRKQHFTRIYDEAQASFNKSKNPNHIHGAYLIVKELLLRGGMFMRDYYREACEVTLRLKDHQDPWIHAQVVFVIPILAGYAPELFVQSYLHKFMTFLQGQLKDDSQRNAAFVAIGKIAHAVGSAITNYLDGILVFVREGLSVKARKKGDTEEGPVFQCLSMLSIAVGMALTKYMDALIDPMFACGLSKSLTQALVDMAHYVHPVRPQIQEKLLDLLSLVLSGHPFKPLGCPRDRIPPTPAFARDFNFTAPRPPDEITLALDVLGSFDFAGHVLNEFVRDVALGYTDNNNPRIRKASALTCCQLFIRDPIIHQTSFHSIRVVSDVLEKLLMVAVADTDADIRRTVLVALDTRFDKHLAKPENIRKLFLAINDSDLEVREAAIVIVGRLTAVNPAHVFPSLRKLLINLIMAIQSSNDPKNQEDAANLIGLVIENASKLARPYCNSLVEVLIPKAEGKNSAVASTALMSLGQLATVGGTDLVPHIKGLMPTIVTALQDLSSHRKREAALHTLGHLASNCAYVIKPYEEYPQLLDIMIGIIKVEPQGNLRKSTINLLGILGALDPYKYQQIKQANGETRVIEDEEAITDVSLIIQGMTPASEEYYPKIVFYTLMNNVLKDPSLSVHHTVVIEAIVTIFQTLGLKCIPYLAQIIPCFDSVIRATPVQRIDAYFSKLAELVRVVRIHIRNYVGPLTRLIEDYWSSTGRVQDTLLLLLEALSRAMENEFKKQITQVLPLLLNSLSTGRPGCEKIFHTILVFGQSAEEQMHLIIPTLVGTFLNPSNSIGMRKAAIDTIGKISRQVNISDYASMIIHSLTQVFALSPKESGLSKSALDCISAYVFQLGRDYLLYAPTVKKVIDQHGVSHANYDLLVSKLQKGEPLPQDLSPDENYGTLGDENQLADVGQKKLPVNQEHLKSAWDASQKSTPEDWQEWMRRFSVELLKESPSHALRACAGLAGIYHPLAKDLFNSAFASCWVELYEQYQEELLLSLEMALASANIPPEILQVLLNLCEFMEHDDRALPLDIRRLGSYAAKNHAFAKALHYKELEFEEDKTTGPIEALISINNQLQQSDAAVGILRTAQHYRDFDLKETWYEKLERWDEALAAYQRREKLEPQSFEVTMGKMRCLHALGEWDDLSNLAEQKWNLASIDHKRSLAPLAAAAAWGLGRWELMDNYLDGMKANSTDRSFFGAILALHRNQFPQAATFIEKAREGLDTELTSLLGESYNRAYIVVVRVQILAELEEIITYKRCKDNPEKLETMRKTWNKRLKGCQKNHEVWQRMLKVRALVLTPRQNIDMWIKFANLCRKSGRMGLAEKSLDLLKDSADQAIGNSALLQNGGPGANAPYGSTGIPEVMYAQLKYKWANGAQPKTLERLQTFTADLSSRLNAQSNSNGQNGTSGTNGIFGASDTLNTTGTPRRDMKSATKLLAKCYVKQGEWLTTLRQGDWRSEHVQDIIDSYAHATEYNGNWYKAWHSWALANFEVVTATTAQAMKDDANVTQSTVTKYVVPAVRGFFKSIALTSTSSLQDTLRLLTLWFTHGQHHEVNTAVLEGFGEVSIDIWLEVIPQLIARINVPNKRVRESIHRLLTDIGKAHPQALVYPLTVTMKSNVALRSRSAGQIMERMREHSPTLVANADTVAHELIRVAVLWHELWHEGLEEASRLYIILRLFERRLTNDDIDRWFGDQDIVGMFATLEPLHKQLNSGAETLREMSFVQAFGRELDEAFRYCEKFRISGDMADINQAWDLYYNVFRRIQRQLPGLLQVDLSYVSPKLEKAKNLDLAVPGTYHVGKPVIQISSFDRMVTIIPSKQRPRKMTIRGNDGLGYEFCLKGHEDIRQDERVMQLFGLVNTLLTNDTESFKRHLNIQPYPAIPLSQQSGLLGWVPNSETMHNLIKDYREHRRILLNIEHRIMLQMAPDFDNLTLMQKVEVFSYAMDNTTGKDLYRVLWLKSKSSEAWLERRTTYTRSLATMSMVGYILGLGDRHPSNLLIDKNTGQVVHIDFGDCFEVAMHREKYPERVPFRLTRMLTFAMEVSNIDGSYKISCEAVMRVIRSNKESLMAVLEAFIHDPLLNWRLGRRESPVEPTFQSERRNSIITTDQAGQQNAPNNPTNPDNQTNDFAVGRPSSGGRNRRLSALQAGALDPQEANEKVEVQNARAVQVLDRVRQKLVGRDFKQDEELGIEEQVAKLIRQATNVENLCQHYIGWCSFW